MTTAARTPITATMTRATRNSKTRIIPEFSEASLRHTLGVCFRRRIGPPGGATDGVGKKPKPWMLLAHGLERYLRKAPAVRLENDGFCRLSGDSPALPGPGPGKASDDAQLQCLQHRAGTVAHAELGQDVGNVILDRALGHLERIGDLLVAVTAGQQPQDLGLALG